MIVMLFLVDYRLCGCSVVIEASLLESFGLRRFNAYVIIEVVYHLKLRRFGILIIPEHQV